MANVPRPHVDAAGGVIMSTGGFLTRQRTHAAGQEESLTKGCFDAFRLALRRSTAAKRAREMRSTHRHPRPLAYRNALSRERPRVEPSVRPDCSLPVTRPCAGTGRPAASRARRPPGLACRCRRTSTSGHHTGLHDAAERRVRRAVGRGGERLDATGRCAGQREPAATWEAGSWQVSPTQ
jgi:hypothetical protein